MEDDEINGDYEKETGKLIVETFRNVDYISTPGILVNNHGPLLGGKALKKLFTMQLY